MSFLTLFLLVLIIALVAGNALLSLTASRRRKHKFQLENSSFSFPSVQEPEVIVSSSSDSAADRLALLDARINALNNKTIMAHDRLQRIETMLFQALNQGANQALQQPAGSSLDATIIGTKVNRLMDFKSNAEIELAAIKDALREKGIMQPLEAEKFSDEMRLKHRKANRDISDIERRAHELIYHASRK